ncbi:MAG: PorT family protein [Bacteroidetes bacterium]|nr:PorT family protein [Bacteroidota bacterium]
MKKTFVLFFTLATTSLVNGQVLKNLGIKGGVSIANQTWNLKSENKTLDADARNGFYGAVSLEFLKSKYLTLTTDFGYCAKGSTQKVANTTNDMPEGNGTYKTYDSKFNYFTLSPMLKARYEVSHFIPYALLGLRMDYQLSYKSDFDYEQIDNDFHKTIWGTNFGVGLEYKTKQLGFLLEGQYQYDFTKVIDTPTSSNNTGLKVNNSAFVICIGLKYYLLKKND